MISPLENIFNGGTTEEEFDVVDALLSLSTVRDNATETSLDDNSSLMPIGGNSIYQDVNPVTVHLDQVSVDGAIAKIVQDESISEAVDNGKIDNEPPTDDIAGVQLDDAIESEDAEWSDPKNTPVSGVQNTLSGAQTASSGVQHDNPENTPVSGVQNTLSGIQTASSGVQHDNPENTPVSGVQNTLSGVQTASSGIQHDDTSRKDDEPSVDNNEDGTNSTKSKGYVKVTTHGIRKKKNSDCRSYRCSVCGIRKRSAHNLNVHHRKQHSAQMCGVCGKFFDLASSLSHHMYTHNERRFFCEKCSFHCHFESELKKHNISHHSQPSQNEIVAGGLNVSPTLFCMLKLTKKNFSNVTHVTLQPHYRSTLKNTRNHTKIHYRTRVIFVANDSFGDQEYVRTKSRNIPILNCRLVP